jgi:hypothetical protein
MNHFQKLIERLNLRTRSEAELEIKWLSDIFSLHQKESAIFKESRIYLQRNHGKLMQWYEYDCYNFQILCELLTRYKKEMWIHTKQEKYILDSQDGISFVNRFLMIWHYNAVGKYLRNILEDAISFSFEKLWWTWKVNRYNQLNYIRKNNTLEKWELIYQPSQDSKVFVSEIYKIYEYLCDYVHHISRIEHIEFNEKQFDKMMYLSSITLRIAWKIYTLWIGEKIQKYWHNEIYKVVDMNRNYRAYILYLITDNSLSINLRRDRLDKYWLQDLHIDAKKLFPPSYFE